MKHIDAASWLYFGFNMVKKKKPMTDEDVRRFQFEHGANGFPSWLTAAEDLMNGANAVKAQVLDLGQMMHSLAAVWALLLGLAIECLLKGKWVKDGNKLVLPGTDKLQRIPNAGRDHSLLLLADAVGFETAATERDVLERLSAFVLWAGRYPVPMNPQDLRHRRNIAPRFFSAQDFDIAEVIAKRLTSELRIVLFRGR